MRAVILLTFAGVLSLCAQSPRAAAPVDLTGTWVSVVTEDWEYRMVTPAKGDYTSVPLNTEGRKIADSWNPAADEAAGNQCKAYGAAALMRVPAHIRISWQGDNILKIESDAGTQTRLFNFGASANQGGDWQGVSTARWEAQRDGAGKVLSGSLRVVTNKMKAGYLRKNGVPYSANTVLTEDYDVLHETNGTTFLIISTTVDDPQYLSEPFLTSTNFKKVADGAGWNPTPCSAK